MPWIHHPATQDGPVSLWRWLRYHVGDWLYTRGNRMMNRALYPDGGDELPF